MMLYFVSTVAAFGLVCIIYELKTSFLKLRDRTTEYSSGDLVWFLFMDTIYYKQGNKNTFKFSCSVNASGAL